MNPLVRFASLLITIALCTALPAQTENYPVPKEGSWTARDFKFHSGEVMPETTQPRNMSRLLTYFSIATSNGNINLYNAAPNAAQGDAFLAKRIATPFRGDANDVLYQWESSADYDPSAALERVQATVLAINAADDERNPPELGMMERAMKRVKNGRYLQISQSADTRGHGTTGMAKFYRKELAELLEQAPRRR
ncbi:MAG: hypothetical protein OEW79_03725 [Betaproteobacteria bacterium]|jgi:homoserine O-acetyltransferase|nr:hypothetical protein [Betaproteobacteria bacterium]MDH5341925.1 hypothetical protein [Betaproteobacteria bacterium]